MWNLSSGKLSTDKADNSIDVEVSIEWVRLFLIIFITFY